jgi:hypothetical protein
MAIVTGLLQKVVIFKDLDGDELSQVANFCHEENFAPGVCAGGPSSPVC